MPFGARSSSPKPVVLGCCSARSRGRRSPASPRRPPGFSGGEHRREPTRRTAGRWPSILPLSNVTPAAKATRIGGTTGSPPVPVGLHARPAKKATV